MFIWLRSCCPLRVGLLAAIAVFAFLAIAPVMRAADDSEEFDNYKIRADLFWFYSSPSGNPQGSGLNALTDIDSILPFNNYSTFSGLLDRKFTHKNHLTLSISPFQQSRNVVLDRTVTYQARPTMWEPPSMPIPRRICTLRDTNTTSFAAAAVTLESACNWTCSIPTPP